MPLLKHVPAVAESPKAPEAAAPQAEAPKAEAPKPEAAKPAYTGRKASSDTMSKDEWAAKDRRISRSGVVQAAIQSVGVNQYATGRTLDEYLDVVEKAADRMLAWVNKCD